MRSRYSRRDVLKSGAALAGLAIAGCTPTGSPSQPSSSTTTGQPKRGGVVRTVYQSEAPHLDPTDQTSYATHGVLGAPYSRLIQFKAGPGIPFTSTELAPDLAVSWEIPDPTTYVLKLRQGVKWHNKAPLNGRPFTAEDAKWALEFWADRNNKNVHSGLFTSMDRVQVVDPQTLRITLKNPQASFLASSLAGHYSKMLPPEVWEKEGSYKNTLVGTGPFVFDRWDRGSKFVLARNPEYYETGVPYIDSYEWIIQADYASRLAMLRSGDIDYGPEPTGVQPEDVDSMKQQMPELTWTKQQRANSFWLAVNNSRKPFDDVRVRQAISLAIDRKDLIKTIFFGDGTVEGIMPNGIDYALPAAEIDKTFGGRDVNRAKQLLAAAGFPNGFETELLPRESQGFELAMTEAVVSMLKDVGITARLRITTRPEWTQALTQKSYAMAQGLGQTSFEPDDWTYNLFHSKQSRNWWGYADPRADAMMEKSVAEVNDAERRKQLLEVQRYLNEQLPYIPLVYRYENLPVQPYLRDFHNHWSYGLPYMRYAWLNK